MRPLLLALLLSVGVAGAACGDGPSPFSFIDAGPRDGSPDPIDAATDAAADVVLSVEAGPDGAIDAAVDAFLDASDASRDGAPDATGSPCPTGVHVLGPLQPTLSGSGTGVGTRAWSAVANARVSDDFHANVSAMVSGEVSNYLQQQGYGFNVPPNATVTGVVMSIERRASNAIADQEVRLLRAGIVVGANRASAAAWPASDGVVNYGSSGDLWGLSLAPSEVNSVNFGAALAAKYTSAAGNGTPEVDQVRISVHYTCP